MAKNFVDIALIELDGKELQTVMSLDVATADPGAEPVTTMNRNRRALGYKSGIATYETTLEARIQVPAEVDWHGLRKNGTLFLLAYEENVGGAKWLLRDSRVVEVSNSYNDEGEATLSIKIISLDHKEE